jgi:haloalkane dehalogenase
MDALDWTFDGTWPYAPRWLFPSDGVRLHYVDEGPRSPEATVFLHDAPRWSYAFRHELGAAAAAGHRAIAYDRLGFGRSDKPARVGEYSPERDLAHLAALLDEAAVGRATLAGIGDGAHVASAFAARHPERVVRVEERPEAVPVGDVMRAPLVGTLLVKGARLPVRRAAATREERAAYLAPHPSWASRSGIVSALRRW